MEKEVILHLVKLLKEGCRPNELICNYDYSSEDVFLSLKIIEYFKSLKQERQVLLFQNG